MIALLFILETEERQNGIYCLKFLKKWNDCVGYTCIPNHKTHSTHVQHDYRYTPIPQTRSD